MHTTSPKKIAQPQHSDVDSKTIDLSQRILCQDRLDGNSRELFLNLDTFSSLLDNLNNLIQQHETWEDIHPSGLTPLLLIRVEGKDN